MSKRVSVLGELWLGTEASYQEAQNLALQHLEMSAGWTPDEEEDQEETPYLFDLQGHVGVITITGPISNSTKWYDSIVKSATYPAIRDALIYAAENENVKEVVLNINSPGGTVNGIADTANLIKLVGSIKPVTAYADGRMCSAAYWMASSANRIYASNVSEVGSIGVVITHMDYSEKLAQEGIKATVFRSGKYKMLGNPVEPLTELARNEIQASIDAVYKVFVQHVALSRNRSVDDVEQNMAQGRVFIGNDALSAGLIDGVVTYDSLMSKLEAQALAKVQGTNQHSGILISTGDTSMPKALTEQQLAALAAGVTAELAATSATQTAEQEPASVADEPEATAEATTHAAQEVTENSKGTEAVVQMLQTNLASERQAVIDLTVSNRELTAKLETLQATLKSLTAIAVASTNNMRVAMNGAALNMDSMSAEQVVADHEAVAAQFKSQFVAGGVAAVSATETTENAAAVDPMFILRVAAAGSSVKA